MKTILSKTRNQLIKENKIRDYLLSGIGEIALLITGILLALWIDQQADYQNERDDELEIIKEIKANLEVDLDIISNDLEVMKRVDIYCDSVTLFLNKNDTPSYKFGYYVPKTLISPHFNSVQSGYKLLTSKGIKIIRNDSLRRHISELYDSDYPYYTRYENEHNAFINMHGYSLVKQYFSWYNDTSTVYLGSYSISNNDYGELKENGDFLKLTSLLKAENNVVKSRATRISNKISSLILFLEAEIKEFHND